MKNLMKLIQVSLIIFTMTIATQAQVNNEMKRKTFHVGYVPSSALSSSVGIHLGYSQLGKSQKQVVSEAQLSYTLATFSGPGDFFERGDGSLQSLNAIGGARFYFSKRENGKGNIYFNTLAGLNVVFDNNNNETDVHILPGGSIGLYVETPNNLSLGLAIESVLSMVFKVGYNF